MALAWQPVDLRSDPYEVEYQGDPQDVLVALSELLERPAWHARAACRGRGPEPWFPNRGEKLDAAREVCDGCSVKDECLQAALEVAHSVDYGVWAGTSVRARKQLRIARTELGAELARQLPGNLAQMLTRGQSA